MTDQTPDTQPDETDSPRRYWKSTIFVYSPYDPAGVELVDLAQDATDGESISFGGNAVEVTPDNDPAFPREFFMVEDDDEDVEDPEEEDS